MPKPYKPNLFIVGQPKSGTTALDYYLNQHQDIFMSRPKEPAYFCTDLINESLTAGRGSLFYQYSSKNDYLELFNNSGNHKIVGESSTSYLYSKTAATNIAKFNPDAKIIMVLREPVDFLYSLYQFHLNDMSETIPNFEDALIAEGKRKLGQNIPKRAGTPSLLYYSERIKYSEQISRYFGCFPRSNILIIIYDDFRRDNHRVTKEVFKFLGVDQDFTPVYNIINPSAVPRSRIINSIIRIPIIKKVFKNLLRPTTYYRFQTSIQNRLMVPGKFPPLSHKSAEELRRQFRPEVKKLADLLSRDLLKEWDYQSTR